LLKCKSNAEVERVGIEWGIKQSSELMKEGVPCIHYYTMSNSDAVKAIASKIF
jgi:methylenetetrahydrofolate reductase (NADPH)